VGAQYNQRDLENGQREARERIRNLFLPLLDLKMDEEGLRQARWMCPEAEKCKEMDSLFKPPGRNVALQNLQFSQ